MGHLALKRAIRHAEARDLVSRNVATLADTPTGQAGRPSKSLTLDQAVALIAATAGTRIGAYIVLCLTTGIRTEEARALRWENISFGAPNADPPTPASVEVWRSVRAHGDTKTERSRRLKLPQLAVDALIELRRQTGGPGLVFYTRTGAPLDAANVRREFRAACKAAGIGTTWTPRELRHSFVSLMSDSGVPVEEIARLAGHANSRTTETVYRHQLKPIMTAGGETMDKLLARSC
jgi:integrase